MSESSPFRYAKADDSPGFVLWKVTVLWQRKLARVLAEFGLNQTRYAILASLRWFQEKGEPANQTHLVEHAKIDKMTVSKAIRKLEVDGLIRRTPSMLDGRATTVRFTDRGGQIIQKAIAAVEQADEDFFSCLTEKQLDAYKILILKVINGNDV